MRIFAAGVSTETNTFAPFPTGLRGFVEGGLHRGDASRTGTDPFALVVRSWRERAERDGHDFVEGLVAFAQPSGRTVRRVWEDFRQEIVETALAEGPFDLILMPLHGAMAADGYDDCEGDMITAMRRAFPDAVIGVELDPHCHLTPEMLEGADAIVLMKEYPHVDYVERAAELYRICTGAVEGKVRPVQAVFDMHMVGFYPTTSQPMVGLLEQLFAAEREPGILSVSFAHGFPWADVEYVGSRLLVIADGDAELAARTAERLGLAIYRARRELLPQYPDIGQSLQLAAETNGRVVLADTADNPGGGAPGDDTRLLAAILERRLDRVALGPIWDPVAAATAAEAGVGARFLLRIGGKNGVASGTPLDLDIEVCGIAEDFQPAGLGPGARQPMGLSVWVRASGIDLVLCSMRTQGFHPELFTGLGISLEDKRLVVVKSSQHFRAGFDSMADLVIQAATPGTLNMDFSRLPYTRRDGNYFPRVADPLRLDG